MSAKRENSVSADTPDGARPAPARAGLAFGPAYGPVFGPAFGLAGIRYVALLLLTRTGTKRSLPRRLGKFLNWCYQAGLIRIAGGGYQFRHRELQDYLARHPQP